MDRNELLVNPSLVYRNTENSDSTNLASFPGKKNGFTLKQKIIAGVVAVVLIVGIILIFTLGKKDTPVDNSIWNPYVVTFNYSYKSKY
jgi:hypothetical protein